MNQKRKHKTAIFFAILFIAIISAPVIIASIDNSIDISCFYGIEEEESEKLKLAFNDSLLDDDEIKLDFTAKNSVRYTFKNYPPPYLNLISPPPKHYI